jgi:hypothetical protein
MFEKPPLGTTPVGLANTIPEVAGKVSVVDPAVAGADSVTDPEVSPEMTTDDII